MYLFAFLPTGTLTLIVASLRLSGLARKTIFSRLLLLTSFFSHIWHQILLLIISELEKMNCSNSSRTLFSELSLFPFIYVFKLPNSFLRSPLSLPTSIYASQHTLTILFFQFTLPRLVDWTGIWFVSQYGRSYYMCGLYITWIAIFPAFDICVFF